MTPDLMFTQTRPSALPGEFRFTIYDRDNCDYGVVVYRTGTEITLAPMGGATIKDAEAMYAAYQNNDGSIIGDFWSEE